MRPLHRRKFMNEPASHGDGRPVAGNKVDEQSPISPKTTEPTSAQQLASPPSDKERGQSLPFHVAIADGGLEITAKTKNEEDVDNLIHILQTIKPLLRDIYGNNQVSSPICPTGPKSKIMRSALS